MAAIQVAVMNASTILTDEEVSKVVQPLQNQVHGHFFPVWGIDADLVWVAKGDQPPSGAWWLTMLDDADQADALGYHETTDQGLPLGKVFAHTARQDGVNWTITASHELLEMLGDPEINLTVFVQPSDTTGTLYAYEVCDACEADQFGYQIGETWVSDFVYPAWFEPSRATGSTQFDYSNQLNAPVPTLLAGGYIGAFDVGSGSGWHQITAMGHLKVKGARSAHAPKGSRRDRRGRGRNQWRKSAVKFK
jgi:hypothetical protein